VDGETSVAPCSCDLLLDGQGGVGCGGLWLVGSSSSLLLVRSILGGRWDGGKGGARESLVPSRGPITARSNVKRCSLQPQWHNIFRSFQLFLSFELSHSLQEGRVAACCCCCCCCCKDGKAHKKLSHLCIMRLLNP